MKIAALLTSFGLVFIAELGDKSLYTVFIQAARHRAAPVLLGSWAAFVVQSGIAVALGSVLRLLPPQLVHYGTAAMFALFGVLFLLKDDAHDAQRAALPQTSYQVFLTTFLLVCAAEWGDATQIASSALVARLDAVVEVFIGSTLGLWAGATLAVISGRVLGQRIPQKLLRRCAGILFCLFALLALFGVQP